MKIYALLFALLFFGNYAESQGPSVAINIVNPCFCRTSSSQNGGGVLSCVVTGGSGTQTIKWYNSAGIVINNNSTLIAGLNAGTYVVEVLDVPMAFYSIDTIKLDSVNPVADFNVISSGLIDLGNDQYQGHISVDVEFKNVSQNFAIPNFAPSDTIFYWSFDPSDPMSWVFKNNVGSENRTFSPGVYEIGLATENYNGCKDTTYATITVEETANIEEFIKNEVVLIPNFDQQRIRVINQDIGAELLLSIFGINGQMITSKQLLNSETVINFNQPKGIYFYQISNRSGEVINAQKFQY